MLPSALSMVQCIINCTANQVLRQKVEFSVRHTVNMASG